MHDDLTKDNVPPPSCPKCQAPSAALLRQISRDSPMNYYACEECGHTWSIPKAQAK